MEKKNYVFKAFTSKGKEIKLRWSNVFYGCTEEEANGIKLGIQVGLCQKYDNPRVTFMEATEQERKEDEERLYKALGL